MSRPCVLSAVIAAASASGVANGQCSNVSRPYVPDFDQKRVGLPYSQGSWHCVPTSCMNWMGYIANRGAPQAMGYSANWALQQHHDYVTSRIEALGNLMDTDGGGTNMGDAIDGLAVYFDIFNVPAIAYGYTSDDDWQVTPKKLANFMRSGWLVNMHFGYWDRVSGDEWERNGGHAVTLVRVNDPCDSFPLVRFRNPSTNDSRDRQSNFESKTWTVFGKVADYEGDVCVRYTPDYNDPNERRVIDKCITILPCFTLTGGNGVAGALMRHTIPLTDPDEAGTVVVPTPNGREVFFAGHRSTGIEQFVVLNQLGLNPAAIYLFDPLESSFARLLNLADNSDAATVNRHGHLVLEASGKVDKYRLNESGKFELLQSVAIAAGADAICCDDATDDIYVYQRSSRTIHRFPAGDLDAAAVVKGIPMTIPIAGRISLAFDTVERKPYICSEGSSTLYQLEIPATGGPYTIGESFSVGAGVEPVGLQIGDRGRLLVIGDGSILEFLRSPASGQYVRTPSRFDGYSANGFLHLPRSTSNESFAKMADPNWGDIPDVDLGPEEPDCFPDYNVDGFVNGDDFDEFVADFEEGDPDADVNFDGFVNGDDFDEFVVGFEKGC